MMRVRRTSAAWAAAEKRKVRAMFEAGHTDAEIGDALGRTRAAIERARLEMGLKRRDGRAQETDRNASNYAARIYQGEPAQGAEPPRCPLSLGRAEANRCEMLAIKYGWEAVMCAVMTARGIPHG